MHLYDWWFEGNYRHHRLLPLSVIEEFYATRLVLGVCAIVVVTVSAPTCAFCLFDRQRPMAPFDGTAFRH
jgi:hypothetical protein